MLSRDPAGVTHILDDTISDGFSHCGRYPTELTEAPVDAVATCLLCIVRSAKYRGLR